MDGFKTGVFFIYLFVLDELFSLRDKVSPIFPHEQINYEYLAAVSNASIFLPIFFINFIYKFQEYNSFLYCSKRSTSYST